MSRSTHQFSERTWTKHVPLPRTSSPEVLVQIGSPTNSTSSCTHFKSFFKRSFCRIWSFWKADPLQFKINLVMSSVILSLGQTFASNSTFCDQTSTESVLGSNTGMRLVKLFDTVPPNASPALAVASVVVGMTVHNCNCQNWPLVEFPPETEHRSCEVPISKISSGLRYQYENRNKPNFTKQCTSVNHTQNDMHLPHKCRTQDVTPSLFPAVNERPNQESVESRYRRAMPANL